MKKILITGGAGYIGSVLARRLLREGYRVRVIDSLMYGGESLIDVLKNSAFEFIKADIRDEATLNDALKDIWAVCHLAAIVGDPACSKEPEQAMSINFKASVRLYEMAEEAGVERFVFASTCSNYGKMSELSDYLDEDAVLKPVSLYAESKVKFEKYLLSRAKTNICKPTVLRFATAYGLSPRMRFDLTVNEFSRELLLGRELLVYGEQFWRPYCHVVDLAAANLKVLKSRQNKVAFSVFNVGDSEENYTKKMLVEAIKEQVTNANIIFIHKEEDLRDYRVNFDKIKRDLRFRITVRVPDGIKEIKYILEKGLISDPYDQRYSNTSGEG